ncbi:putative F-box protein At1g32420 [Silene latifolia]|uniref:putative F-box protein At1g32420 n=1 Tax=Silene latifolia TaxID=37657 RepID=UPI003D76F50E
MGLIQANWEIYTVEPSRAHLSFSKIFTYTAGRYVNFQSSGGLICVYLTELRSFRILNPHIAEEVEVPDVPKFKEFSHSNKWFFSYSPSTKEYKILNIGVLRRNDDRETGLASIRTLGSNNWRELENVPPYLSDLFAECQGKLFWIAKSGLISFDLVSEKFHEIPGPQDNPVHEIHYIRRYESDKLINMGHTIGYLRNYRLWVLEDKTKGIWINKCVAYRISVGLMRGLSITLLRNCLFGVFIALETEHDITNRISGQELTDRLAYS